MPEHREDPVLRSGRREAIVAAVLWAATFVYAVTYCGLRGYGREPKTLTFILGFPDWVFWGIIVPWFWCIVLSFWFAFRFMRDEDLGAEREGADGE